MRIAACALLATLMAGAADRPTPRQKAKQLLDSAAEMIGATRPDVQPAALMHLADNYREFDRKKSIEYFEQAFAAAGTPPAASSTFARSIQADIAVMAASLDAEKAVALLKQIPPVTNGYDNRSFAASRLMGVLVAQDKVAAAVELAGYMGGAGAYPFSGASQVLRKLPPDDSQRVALFSAMIAAYSVKPDRTFHSVLMRYHKELPPGMAEAALDKVLTAILDRKNEDQDARTETLASSKGTVTFTNSKEAELFDVMPLVREVDPKRYDELVSKYAGLRSALQLFPGGGSSVADERGLSSYTTSGSGNKSAADALNSRMQMEALIKSRADSVLQQSARDPDLALDRIGEIPSPAKQAEVLGRIAESVAENDDVRARHVLSKCTTLLEDVKAPADRILAWDAVAAAAARVKDDAIVQSAIDRLLADAGELYKVDTNSDRPNRSWREYWPSTQAYRRAVIRATRLMGIDAEAILQKITDTDINVLARLTMAQTLLNRPYESFPTFGFGRGSSQ